MNSNNGSDRPQSSVPITQSSAVVPQARPLSNKISYDYYSTQKERPVREYIAIAIHYRYLILICTILGAIAGYYQNKKVPVEFTGEALVSIGSYLPATDGPTAAALQIESSKQDYVTNLLQFIMSYRIAQYIFLTDERIWKHYNSQTEQPKKEKHEQANEDETAAFERQLYDEELAAKISVNMLESYLRGISFTQVSGGSLVRIYARASNAEMAAYIANTHANAFIDLVRDQRRQTAAVNVKFLKKRVSDLSQKAADNENKMMQFAKDHNLTPQAAIASDGNIGNIVNGLSEATAEKAWLEQQVRDLRPSSSLTNMKLKDDTMPLVQKLTELESQYAAIQSINRTHPELKAISTQMDNIKKIIRFSADQQRKESEMKRKAVAAKEYLLRNEFQRLKEKELDQSQNRIQYSVLEREHALSKDTLEQAKKRLEDALIQAESDQKTAQVVDAAVPPQYPSMAPRSTNILTTMLIGLFVGIGLAFLLDSQDGSIRTLTDLKQTLDLPVLGVIPVFSKKLLQFRAEANISKRDQDEFQLLEDDLVDLTTQTGFSEAIDSLYDRTDKSSSKSKLSLRNENHPVVIMSAPFSREAEAFRNLRATIMFSRHHAPPKKILFTSAQKGVGKSTVAVNVAASIAQTGVKVVLIDADLRMPTTHEHFGIGRMQTGLSDYLEGNAKLEDTIIDTGSANLSLIPAGSPTHNPSELLSSPTMADLFNLLESQYSLVVVDTPPVGEIADALLMSHLADGVIMVVRSGVSLKNSAKLACTKLQQVKANILGTAFNGVNNLTTFREGYEYYYSKYGSYSYHSYHKGPETSTKTASSKISDLDINADI